MCVFIEPAFGPISLTAKRRPRDPQLQPPDLSPTFVRAPTPTSTVARSVLTQGLVPSGFRRLPRIVLLARKSTPPGSFEALFCGPLISAFPNLRYTHSLFTNSYGSAYQFSGGNVTPIRQVYRFPTCTRLCTGRLQDPIGCLSYKDKVGVFGHNPALQGTCADLSPEPSLVQRHDG